MSTPPTFRILHISDFHCLEGGSPFHRKIVECLIQDLQSQKDRGISFDLAIFTGDLTQSGDPNQFEEAKTSLLEPVCQVTGLAPGSVLIVPGNHDVAWSLIDEDHEAGLQNRLTGSEEVEALLGDANRRTRALERQEPFYQFLEDWYGDSPPNTVEPVAQTVTIRHEGTDIGIALLNSAWRSSNRSDQGQLWVGELQMASALDALSSSKFRITALHHPLAWLHDHDIRGLQPWIQRDANLVVTGHTHVAQPSLLVDPAGSTVYSGAGCLYESSRYLNAYSVITLNLDAESFSFQVGVRQYAPGVGFTAAGEAGQFSGNGIPYEAGRSAITPARPSPTVISRYLVDLAKKHSVIAHHLERRGPTRLSEVFVDPIFLPMPYPDLARGLGGKDYEKHHLTPSAFFDEDSIVSVCGEGETGLTGSLLWLLDQSGLTANQRIPIYVNSGDLISGRSLVQTAIRHGLIEFDISLGRTDALPGIVLAIDNADDLKGRQLEHIVRFATENPQHKVILGWHNERLQASDRLNALAVENAYHQLCYLGPLGIPELKSIVSKLTPEAGPDVVDIILRILRLEGLPRTPYVMTLLAILVAESNSQLEALTESVLLDKYVTHLLELAAGGQDSRVGYDPDNWSRILEHVAEQFRRDGVRTKSRLEVDQLVIDYFRTLTWGESVLPIVEQLLEWRLLGQNGDQVGFWHPALLDIFLGRRINNEYKTASHELPDSLTNRALAMPLKHARPLKHAAALAKGNRDMLERIAAFDAQTFSERAMGLAQSELPSIAMHSGWTETEGFDKLAEQVRMEVPSAEEREQREIAAWQEFEATHADDVPPTDFGDDDSDGLLDELFETVRLFSAVLRSSEHLADAELKRELLFRAVDQWSSLAILLFVEEDVHKTSTALVTKLFEQNPKAKKDDLAAFVDRLVSLLLVMFISQDMSEALGTQKMNQLLGSLLEDEEFFGNPARALFGALLYSELETARGSKWLDYFEKLHERYRDYTIVIDVLRINLQKHFYFSTVRNEDRQRLANLLAEVTLDANGVSGTSLRSEGKGKILAELRLKQLNPGGQLSEDEAIQ